MLRIRLRRIGKKGIPHYRVVVADQRSKRDGRFLENLGSYDPHADPPAANLNVDHARDWLAKGAQPSDSVEKIFRRVGIIEGGPVQRPQQPSTATAEAPAAAETAVEAEAAAEQAEDVAEAVLASAADAVPGSVEGEAVAAAEDVTESENETSEEK